MGKEEGNGKRKSKNSQYLCTGTDRHDPDQEAGVAGEKEEDGDVVGHQVQPPVGRGERTVQQHRVVLQPVQFTRQ